MKNYICLLKDDVGDDLSLQLSDEFCKENDWLIDDTISFNVDENGIVTMTNLSKPYREKQRNETLHRSI